MPRKRKRPLPIKLRTQSYQDVCTLPQITQYVLILVLSWLVVDLKHTVSRQTLLRRVCLIPNYV